MPTAILSVMRVALVLLYASLVACGGSGPTARRGGKAVPPSRQDSVVPTAYRLELAIDPRKSGFRGKVVIDMRIDAATDRVELNSLGLEIQSARIGQGSKLRPAKVEANLERETITLVGGSELAPGEARLEIEFKGQLGADVGLFRQHVDGRWYVFSDFQPVDARRAFPCFDDPRFRAPWAVTLVVPKGSVAVSNMQVVSRGPSSTSLEQVVYETTPALPSYLLAMAVGPFDVVVGPKTPVPLRALTLRGRGRLARAALERMPAYLAWMTEYTGIAPALGKLDLIAVPGLNGAMENHGLFTFNEDILLTPKDAEVARIQLLHMVLAHEAAHIWFGNMVGFRRWHEVWLSEGFATLMADEMGKALHPEESIEVRQITYRQDAMHVDRQPGARAMEALGAGPRAAEDAFDPLSYKKAGAVLAMVQSTLGPEGFRAAVRNYLSRGRGRAVSAQLLVETMSRGKPFLTRTLDEFTSRPGFPLLKGTSTCGDPSNPDARPALRISQSRYHWRVGASTAEPLTEAPWSLPVCVVVGGDDGVKEHCEVSTSTRKDIVLPACPSWWLVNPDGAAYAQISLSAGDLKRLQGAPLRPRQWAVVVDAIDAALDSGSLTPRASFETLAAARRVDDQHVTNQVLRLVSRLLRHLEGDSRDALRATVGKVLMDRARQLGFSDRSPGSVHDKVHRSLILRLAGAAFRDEVIIDGAKRLASKVLTEPGHHGPRDVVVAALEVFAHEMSVADVDALVARCEQETRVLLLRDQVGTLASVKRAETARRALQLFHQSNRLRPFGGHLVISYAGNVATAGVALEHVATQTGSSHPEAKLLRERFSVGLCDPKLIPVLDRVFPPEPDDQAAARIRTCASRRQLLR